MAKKRICLIGRELGAGSSHGAYLGNQRLQEVLDWAGRHAFDGVGVLSTTDGVVVADASTFPEGEAGMLSAMGAKGRAAWADRVSEQVVVHWGLDAELAPSEIVLLCGLSGYQELAEALRNRLPGVAVTRPVAGTGIVNRSSRLLEVHGAEPAAAQ